MSKVKTEFHFFPNGTLHRRGGGCCKGTHTHKCGGLVHTEETGSMLGDYHECDGCGQWRNGRMISGSTYGVLSGKVSIAERRKAVANAS
jgi:hypothetical protein